MRHDRRWRRRLARVFVAVAAAAAPGLAATPAHAGPDAYVDAFIDEVVIGADGSPGKAVPIFVAGAGVVNPVLTINLSGLDGLATAEFADERCKVAGTTATCSLPDNAEFFDIIPVVFHPVDGVADGDEGTITYTTKADGIDPVEQTATLTVRDGVDLVAFPAAEKTVKAGGSYAAPIRFANYGNQAANGIDVLLDFSWGVIPEEYSNCSYEEVEEYLTLAVCHFDETFEPNGSTIYELAPFGTQIAPDAVGPQEVNFFVLPSEEPVELPEGMKLASKGGKELTLTATTAQAQVPSLEIDSLDNLGTDRLTVENSFDVAAVGADLTGAVGDVVTVKVGVQNLATGTLAANMLDIFIVLVPPGAEVVTVPESCAALIEGSDGTTHAEPGKAGESKYRCYTTEFFLRRGETDLVEFGMKIKSLDAAPGAVTLDNEYATPPAWDDDNNANNTAAITLGSGDTGGAGGGLPVTGLKVGAIAGGGGVLLAAGVVLFLVTRRRRVVLVADDSNN
jgi:hypothetical protein